jgi:hypothetical protein
MAVEVGLMTEHAGAFVAHHRDAWWWIEVPGPGAQRVGADQIAARLRTPGPDEAPPPEGDWVGRVVDGRLLLGVGDAERAIDPTARPRRTRRRRLVRSASRPGPVPAPRGPLRDAAASSVLLERGWTTLSMLDGCEVERLREAYGREHGWSGSGFEPDPGNADFEYRARVARAVGEVIDPHLDHCFERFRPFLRGFYCKWPGEGHTALHWDWSCVDERVGHRAYQVWIALQDTDDELGGMSVLSRSHRVDPRPRGTELSIPLSVELAERSEQLRRSVRSVPLRAGEAIVFDMGLVHVSAANRTDEPRLAAVVSLRPEEAELTYFRGVGAGLALRFVADEHWYNHMVPVELHDGAPDLPLAEVLDVSGSPGLVERVRGLAERTQLGCSD